MKKLLPPATFIVLRGLPGSGKTTFADALRKKYSFVILNPEKVDRGMKKYVDFCSTKRVRGLPVKKQLYRFLLYEAIRSLDVGKSVLWEQVWSKWDGIAVTMDNIRVLSRSTTNVQPVLVDIHVPMRVARSRVIYRRMSTGSGITLSAFNKLFSGSAFERISRVRALTMGFKYYLKLVGLRAVSDSIAEFGQFFA